MRTLIRLPDLLERRGRIGRSTQYRDVKEGLWTKPVSIGRRAVGWPSDECDTLIAARIAGKSSDEIRSLVQQLEARRADQAAA